jgi:hypothetical protein
MARSRVRTVRTWAAVALALAAVSTGVGVHPATADVTAVRGSAFGYSTTVSLFKGPAADRGPAPTVTLPTTGSAAPVTGSAATGDARYGPGIIFTSGPITVSTQGTTGPTGSVTSSTSIQNVNTSGQEVFTATGVTSTCTASQSGAPSGSTTITGGKLQTNDGDPNVTGDETTVDVPANPAPNTKISGVINSVGDTFEYIFNEQITNPDGSITVNAGHQRLLGPTAVGDLLFGQSVCGITAVAGTTTTAAGVTTTTAAGATTTTAAGATTTTAAGATSTTTSTVAATTTTSATTTTAAGATTTTAAGGTTGVGGGAYGFYVSVGLFGGAPSTRGPAPTVSLPAGGSATPVTATAAEGNGVFGPASIFSSGQLDVSTQGVPGGTVTSSAKVANVNKSTQEVFTAATASSTCTASSSGASGSTSLSGGRLVTSEGANLDSDTDDTVVTLPADPAPNTSYEGKIETVGDTFRYVFNEQIKNADGSITVNAAHQYLLGPTAVGEAIIGQSRCGITAASTGGAGGGKAVVAGSGSGLASTGAEIAVVFAFALLLVVGGGSTLHWSAGARWRERVARRMPWSASGFLR